MFTILDLRAYAAAHRAVDQAGDGDKLPPSKYVDLVLAHIHRKLKARAAQRRQEQSP